MKNINAFLRGAALILGCAAFSLVGYPSPVMANTGQQVSIEQGREIARRAVIDGNYQVAMQVAHALLQRDPDDLQGLLIMAAGHTAMRQPARALPFAKRAFRAAERKDKKNRFTAATMAARALTEQKKYERSKLWLRRAIEVAPNEQLKNTRIRDFRNVRTISPWRTRLNFGFQPSDNVNNGTEEKTIILAGLPFTLNDTEPLNGIKLSFSAASEYRIWQNKTTQVYLGGDLFHREVILTGSNDTTLEKGDFRYTYLGGTLKRRNQIADKNLSVTDLLSFGTSWYSNKGFQDRIALSRSYSKTVGRTKRLDFIIAGEKSMNKDDSIKDANTISLRFGYVQALEGFGVIQVSPYFFDVASDSTTTAQETFGVVFKVSPKNDFLTTKPSYSVEIGQRRNDSSDFTGDRRKDEFVRLSAEFLFKDKSIYGFSPSVKFDAKRTKSNNVLYDTTSLGFDIRFRSSF